MDAIKRVLLTKLTNCHRLNTKHTTGFPPMRAVAIILCLLFISGCGGLIINKEDSAGAKIAKFTTRTVLGVGTLGISEVRLANVKANRDLQAYLASLPPDERRQLTNQLILEREKQRTAAIQAQSMGRAIGQAIGQSIPQTQTLAPLPRTTNCYTTYFGNSAHTQCN